MRNELQTKVKTVKNDEVENFGPFTRNMVAPNEDEEPFTLLEKPQAIFNFDCSPHLLLFGLI